MTRLESKLLQFFADHENTITNALQIHVRDMTKIAEETQTAYEQISKNPATVAAQDQTIMTTNGLRMSAQMFRNSAERAQKALDALEALAEQAEEL